MANSVLVGLQWGDEGKGKIIDVLTEKVDMVIRFQGGNNAGHTVEIGEEKFVLHLVPSGILHDGCQCVIGNGVVVNPLTLDNEIKELEARGFQVTNRLKVSSQAHLVFSWHCIMDGLFENKLGESKIGTTKRGIGPAYADKVNRVGIRAGELLDPGRLEDRFRTQAKFYNDIFAEAGVDIVDIDDEWEKVREVARKLTPMIDDTVITVNHALRDGKCILMEGAQGMWLDVDFGTYPFVTSSNTTAGGACTGSGLPPSSIEHVVGVAKAYTTRVGKGPFMTELNDNVGRQISKIGNEFGATTGRPRRCGWFDAVATGYSAMLNGVDQLAITKLDVLDDFETIKVCTAYELDGQVINHMPIKAVDYSRLKPVYKEIPGWKEKTTNATCWEDLPQRCRDYLKWLAELVNAPLKIISVGPRRDQTFFL